MILLILSSILYYFAYNHNSLYLKFISAGLASLGLINLLAQIEIR